MMLACGLGCLGLALLPFGLAALLLVGALASTLDGSLAGPEALPDNTVEYIVEPAGVEDKIVILPIHGIIHSDFGFAGGVHAETVCQRIERIAEDPTVVAVVLDMNTPGGEVTATDEIHRAMVRLRQDTKIPVVTCMRTLAASGGYYLAAGTDHIVANRLTITGSIGVIIGGYNYAELFDKIGLSTEFYTSGKYKDLLNMGRPRSDAEKAMIQAMVDETFAEFAAIVADGRSLEPDRIRELEARILSGQQALEAGLVDQLGYLDDAVLKARQMAGVPEATVVRYGARPNLRQILMGARSPEPTLQELFPQTRLRRGVPYFIYPLAL